MERKRKRKRERDRAIVICPTPSTSCVRDVMNSVKFLYDDWSMISTTSSLLCTCDTRITSCVDYIVVGKLPVCAAGREWFVYLPVAKRMNHS